MNRNKMPYSPPVLDDDENPISDFDIPFDRDLDFNDYLEDNDLEVSIWDEMTDDEDEDMYGDSY